MMEWMSLWDLIWCAQVLEMLCFWTLFYSLWPRDAIWWHRSGSTLAQVMACCLMAPSHYLSQCWFIIIDVLWHSSVSQVPKKLIYNKCLEIALLQLQPHLPGANELNISVLHHIPSSNITEITPMQYYVSLPHKNITNHGINYIILTLIVTFDTTIDHDCCNEKKSL